MKSKRGANGTTEKENAVPYGFKNLSCGVVVTWHNTDDQSCQCELVKRLAAVHVASTVGNNHSGDMVCRHTRY
jgi:hypothetical protein